MIALRATAEPKFRAEMRREMRRMVRRALMGRDLLGWTWVVGGVVNWFGLV